jgi:hypothetical protein
VVGVQVPDMDFVVPLDEFEEISVELAPVSPLVVDVDERSGLPCADTDRQEGVDVLNEADAVADLENLGHFLVLPSLTGK